MFVGTNTLSPEVVGTSMAISSQKVKDAGHQRNGPLQVSPLVADRQQLLRFLG